MNVLLSVKPKYVDEIKRGKKKYEFRKTLGNKKYFEKINKIFIYSSSPVKKIVASFVFNIVIEDHPKILWEKCKDLSGIEESEFFKYFDKKEKGLAIKISDLKFFKEPIDPKSIFPEFYPPQSFRYIEDIETNMKITHFL
ncbi:MAG: hypothetical protein ACFFCE_19355 [Promethearchaeota archaeon]